jgi:predicted nucleotidyltransferase
MRLQDELNMSALETFCHHWRITELSLFGSAAEGEADADARDSDLLVEFAEAPDMGPADQYFGLLAELEALLNRPVDLVCAGLRRGHAEPLLYP